VEVTEADLAAWKAQAHRQQMNLSTWVRYVLNGYTRAKAA
jgi:hypothetical protein